MKEVTDFLLSAGQVNWPDLKKLINWSYLSDQVVPADSSLTALFAWIYVILIIVGVGLSYYLARLQNRTPIYDRLRYHVINWSLWTGIIGIFLVFARYQGLYLLSSRLLMLANVLLLIGWGGWIAYYRFRVLPQERENYITKQRFERYLPKGKRKGRL